MADRDGGEGTDAVNPKNSSETGDSFERVLGRTIRAARKREGVTQMQLAELLGISDRTMREVEQGTGHPSLSTVVAAAEAVGVRLEARS